MKGDFGVSEPTKSLSVPYEPSPSYSAPASNSIQGSISNLSSSLSSSISSLSSTISPISTGLYNTIYMPGGGSNANGLPSNGNTTPYGQGFVGDPTFTLGGGISAFTPINGQCPQGYSLIDNPNILGAKICTNVGPVRLNALNDLIQSVQAQGYSTVYQWQNAWANIKKSWNLGTGLSMPGGPTKQPPVKNPTEPSPGSPTIPGDTKNPTNPTTPGGTVTPSPVGLDDNIFDVISNLFPGGAGNLDLQGQPRDSEGLIFADYPAEISVPQSSSRSPVLIILVVLGLAGAGYWYYKNRM